MVECNYFECNLLECSSFEAPNIYSNLNDQQFRLNKTNEVKDY